MVFILAASSLHHASEILTPEEKEQSNNKVYRIPALSLNPKTKNLLNILETDHKIEVFSIVKDFISSKKQKDPELPKQYKALHQSPELESKSLDFILRKDSQLSAITDKSRPKRPSKRARNAIKKASLNPSR